MPKGKERPNAWKCEHTERLHYGRGLCSSCYQGWRRKNNMGPRAKCHPDQAHYTGGMCKRCHDRSYLKNHPGLYKKYRKELRMSVIKGLGGKCVCCGESEDQFLSIHHIGGGGRKHEEEVGRGGGIFRDIRKQGYPTNRYQVLCHNCHFAREWFGHCHE